jgi:hypothetical protein
MTIEEITDDYDWQSAFNEGQAKCTGVIGETIDQPLNFED